jgi:hypothetical protein
MWSDGLRHASNGPHPGRVTWYSRKQLPAARLAAWRADARALTGALYGALPATLGRALPRYLAAVQARPGVEGAGLGGGLPLQQVHGAPRARRGVPRPAPRHCAAPRPAKAWPLARLDALPPAAPPPQVHGTGNAAVTAHCDRRDLLGGFIAWLGFPGDAAAAPGQAAAAESGEAAALEGPAEAAAAGRAAGGAGAAAGAAAAAAAPPCPPRPEARFALWSLGLLLRVRHTSHIYLRTASVYHGTPPFELPDGTIAGPAPGSDEGGKLASGGGGEAARAGKGGASRPRAPAAAATAPPAAGGGGAATPPPHRRPLFMGLAFVNKTDVTRQVQAAAGCGGAAETPRRPPPRSAHAGAPNIHAPTATRLP